MTAARICPECKTEYPATKRICAACGVDLATGKKLPMVEEEAPAAAAEVDAFALDESEPPPPPPPPMPTPGKPSKLMPSKSREAPREPLPEPGSAKKALYVVGEYFPGLFHASTLIASILLFVVGLCLWPIGLLWFFMGAVFEGLAACSFGLAAHLQALTILIGGSLDILHEALSAFTGRQWKTFFICWLGPWVLAFCVIGIYRQEISGVTPPTPEEEERRAAQPTLNEKIRQLKNMPSIPAPSPLPVDE